MTHLEMTARRLLKTFQVALFKKLSAYWTTYYNAFQTTNAKGIVDEQGQNHNYGVNQRNPTTEYLISRMSHEVINREC